MHPVDMELNVLQTLDLTFANRSLPLGFDLISARNHITNQK